MNLNIQKRRNNSHIPAVNSYNNWFTQQQQKPSTISYTLRKLTPSSYISTLSSNPQQSTLSDNKQAPTMRRTYSAFKNSQSRVTVLKDKVFELSDEIKLMSQKTKRTRLNFELMSKQLQEQLKQRSSSMKQSIHSLNKLAKSTITISQMRTVEIKKDAVSLGDQYKQLQHQMFQITERMSVIEQQCGFVTYAGKVGR